MYNPIIEMRKTPKVIVAGYKDQTTASISTPAFEKWLDEQSGRMVSYSSTDSESTGDDAYQMTWEQYYKQDEEIVFADLQKYLAHEPTADRNKIIEPLTKVLTEYI